MSYSKPYADKYIESDITNGMTLLKVAFNNIQYCLSHNYKTSFTIPLSLESLFYNHLAVTNTEKDFKVEKIGKKLKIVKISIDSLEKKS